MQRRYPVRAPGDVDRVSVALDELAGRLLRIVQPPDLHQGSPEAMKPKALRITVSEPPSRARARTTPDAFVVWYTVALVLAFILLLIWRP